MTRLGWSREDTVEYRYWYNRGWRYSGSETCQGLDYGDEQRFPEAWYDGYLDYAAGREKWHLLSCIGCPEHRAEGEAI